VPHDAGEQQIKNAYHRLARKFHPDKASEGEGAEKMEAEFSMISTAYNVLKDREKRAAYDQSLEAKRQQGVSSITQVGQSTIGKDSSGTLSGKAVDKSRLSVGRRAYAKALQCIAAGDYPKAIELLDVAIKNNDTDPMYHAKYAQTLLRSRRSFSRAIESAEKAIELDPYNNEHRLVLAEIYESAGSASMAVKVYDEILKWEPGNDRAKQALQHLRPSRMSFLQRFFGRK
jgi:curved DNA-binding protein CbpA